MIKKIENVTTFDKEIHFLNNGFETVIGLDEVGRGPLAGPVVACACALKNPEKLTDIEKNFSDKSWKYLKDSKKITHKKREELIEFIKHHFYTGLGVVESQVIDEINILQATFLAMKKALDEIYKNNNLSKNALLLIDGNKTIPNISLEQVCVIKGDSISKTIASASIVAKVFRDDLMVGYSKDFPEYDFASNKGYGTKNHKQALKLHGATPIHRKSFAPVKEIFEAKSIKK